MPKIQSGIPGARRVSTVGDMTIADLIIALGVNSYAASAFVTGTQGIETAAEEIIDFDSVDQGADYVTTGAAWKYTCSVAGDYWVYARATFATTTSFVIGKIARLNLYKEGALYALLDWQANHDATDHFISIGGGKVVPCAIGDELDVRIYQDTGSTINLASSNVRSHVSIWKLPG